MINEKKVFNDNYNYFLTRVKKARTILNEIIKHTSLKSNYNLKVLAVGGKFGFIEYNLAKWTKWKIITSDVEKKLITKYPILKKYIKMQVLNANKLPFKNNTFDLILFNHVIEHISNYEKAVKEIYRVLKKNGYLYIATPNLYRKLVHPKVLFEKKEKISRERRIALHMGFSKKELIDLFSMFQYHKNITKEHQLSNLNILRYLAHLLPKTVFHRYSQTNVFIFKK